MLSSALVYGQIIWIFSLFLSWGSKHIHNIAKVFKSSDTYFFEDSVMLKVGILYGLALMLTFISTVNYALTFKTGQVIGTDGKVYDGASEQTKQALLHSYDKGGEQTGVMNNNLFIIYEDDVLFVPMYELDGKSDEQIESIIDGKFTEFERKKDIKRVNRENLSVQNQVKQQAQNQAKEQAKSQAKVKAKEQAKAKIKEQTVKRHQNKSKNADGTGAKFKPK